LDTYGSRVVYDASPSIGPKLSSIIRCGKWYWPQARSDDLVVIQRLLPDVEIGEVDHRSGPLRVVSSQVLKLGKGLERGSRLWIGLRLFGSQLLFLVMRSSFGWLFMMLLSLGSICVDGVIMGILCVSSVTLNKRIETISSLSVL